VRHAWRQPSESTSESTVHNSVIYKPVAELDEDIIGHMMSLLHDEDFKAGDKDKELVGCGLYRWSVRRLHACGLVCTNFHSALRTDNVWSGIAKNILVCTSPTDAGLPYARLCKAVGSVVAPGDRFAANGEEWSFSDVRHMSEVAAALESLAMNPAAHGMIVISNLRLSLLKKKMGRNRISFNSQGIHTIRTETAQFQEDFCCKLRFTWTPPDLAGPHPPGTVVSSPWLRCTRELNRWPLAWDKWARTNYRNRLGCNGIRGWRCVRGPIL